MKKKNLKIKKFLVNSNFSIYQTMKEIDKNGFGTAFVVGEKRKLLGVVTDGDIRRAILRGVSIKKKVKDITNTSPFVIKERFSRKDLLYIKLSRELKKKITKGFIRIPVVNKKGVIKDIITIYINQKNEKGKKNINQGNGNNAVKKVLVTGGAGYLGSVLCSKLLERGYEVRVLDSLQYGDHGIKRFYKNNNFKIIKGDIRRISDIIKAIKDIDAVIHLAAIVGDPACKTNPENTLAINYFATKGLVEICKYFQINRFIFASTCSVYGASQKLGRKLNEESSLKPISLYAETKIQCEKIILDAIDENFSPTILRLATLYGISPLMRFDLVVNLLTAKAVKEKEITIFGGEQWRPWLHLEDAANGFIAVLESPIEKIKGEIFNVLSENYKIIDIGKKIKSVCEDAAIKIEDKITDKRNYNISFEKIRRVLDFSPEKKILDGVLGIKKVLSSGKIKNYRKIKYRTILPQV